MSRVLRYGALAGCLLSACDDGRLGAVAPRAALAGAGGSVSGSGPDEPGGTSPADSEMGGDTGAPSSPLFIDDFEDGDPIAKEPFGWWYSINDQTSAQGFGIEPISGTAASVYALRTHGSGFQSWGAAVGVDLIGKSTSLNARGYKQLCFAARIETGSSPMIQVHFLQGEQQRQHYIQELSLSESWNRYCLPLVDFVTSAKVALVPSQLIALQFFFTPPTSPFAFWLDDVELAP
jgi:hypothetical protein